MPMNLYFCLYAILKPDLLADGNLLLDVIVANCDEMELLAKFSKSKLLPSGTSL